METIQLLYVKNIISRKEGFARQELDFGVLVQNFAYQKQVDISWSGENGVWQTLPAQYCNPVSEHYEYWYAHIEFSIFSCKSLPGNIEFAIRYRVDNQEYWDNNKGGNYKIDADCGVVCNPSIQLISLSRDQIITHRSKVYPISVAVFSQNPPKKVLIHWTKDNWKTVKSIPCRFKRDYWDKSVLSNARNPNRYGYGIWTSSLRIGKAYQVEYALECITKDSSFWDSNFGMNYLVHRGRLKVLTLNLHCYQEKDQDKKFSMIAQAIETLGIDIVCLQEVGEPWKSGEGDWNHNAAKIVNERLKKPYFLYTDWSHLGFDQYKEGIAILSKFPMIKKESRYVSPKQDIHDIHARKVLMAQVFVPWAGLINIFSAHLSWWENGFADQWEKLRNWAKQNQTPDVAATLLCGDFNARPDSPGYTLVLQSQEYEDQFLAVTKKDVFTRIFRRGEKDSGRYLAYDYRIDYIFMNKDGKLQGIAAKEIFTGNDYGKVSDHTGYYVEFVPRKQEKL
ncbi:MAG: endonuclease/exonuclease/phosphatase family protein [Candidatus Brocadiae bacterium]|nr:endonuclease/exonuclease/phosphatase family protein [Candidatus Brocadiia bacterium]